MLIKEHHFSLHLHNHVISFVVEELIWSGDYRWPDKFRVTLKPHSAQERTFYGPTPEELVEEAIRYIRRQEVRLLRPTQSFRQVQARSGTNASGD
jgi:hypothetical protein